MYLKVLMPSKSSAALRVSNQQSAKSHTSASTNQERFDMLVDEQIAKDANIAAPPADGGNFGHYLLRNLLLPILLGLTVVIVFESVFLGIQGPSWTNPIKDQMIREELQSMNVRAKERSLLLGKSFRKLENALSKPVMKLLNVGNEMLTDNLVLRAAQDQIKQMCETYVVDSDLVVQTLNNLNQGFRGKNKKHWTRWTRRKK
eukprot:gene19274-6541_t